MDLSKRRFWVPRSAESGEAGQERKEWVGEREEGCNGHLRNGLSVTFRLVVGRGDAFQPVNLPPPLLQTKKGPTVD